MRQYAVVIESLVDIVLNINQKELDRALNQSLALKIRYMITNIREFKDMYIGNHYCPEIVMFLLKEFMLIRFGQMYRAPLKMKKDDEEEDQPTKLDKDGVEQPKMFSKSLGLLKAYCLELEDD